MPTPDEFRHILRNLATPRDKALLLMLATTGCRVGEVLSRKMPELKRMADGYARIDLPAKETKSRYDRNIFLTKECVEATDNYSRNKDFRASTV